MTTHKPLTIHLKIMAVEASEVWLNQPATLTEIFGSTTLQDKIDATNCVQARFIINVTTVAETGANCHPEYDAGSGFLELADTAGELDAATDALGLIDTGFMNIDALAKADITIRIVGEGGNAMVDPAFSVMSVEFK